LISHELYNHNNLAILFPREIFRPDVKSPGVDIVAMEWCTRKHMWI